MDTTMSLPESLPTGTDAGDHEGVDDTLRVIGLCATFHEDERPYLRGCDVVIVAVLKDAVQADAGVRERRRLQSIGCLCLRLIPHTCRSRSTAKPRG